MLDIVFQNETHDYLINKTWNSYKFSSDPTILPIGSKSSNIFLATYPQDPHTSPVFIFILKKLRYQVTH